ncbi:MAG: Ig-like domain-containing protein [Bacteroidales bacterium]|nr:Ig-like domain-containing protein [Bacteroidales bacterium]
MKRFCIISCFLVFCGFLSFGQKDVFISGGTGMSTFIAATGDVYATGSNKVTNGTGVLGVGSSAEYVTSWARVTIPNTTMIQQVSCGGAHFAALNYMGQVWCWGDNTYGECGTGTIGGVVTSPQQVGAGCLGATEYDYGGYIGNVSVVCAGNANTYAILGDGQYQGMVVAWGGNGESYVTPLGDGTTNHRSSPGFCLDLNGNQVTGIVQIAAHDDVVMLLDEDGHVWTTGGISKPTVLGRSTSGGYAASEPSGASYSFGMVYVAEGEPLSNIVQIAAGAVNCQALDCDGYVWGWGDSWNAACGTGGVGGGHVNPKKVVAGSLNDDDTEGGYLLAKAIGAGQSSGYAISKTGKPVMWGKINGINGTSDQPHYVTYSSNSNNVHDDVISLGYGRSFLFYRRSDGSVWAMGDNSSGALGTGSTSSLTYATRINPPTLPDPRPMVFLSPKNVEVCSESVLVTEPVTLDCGFHISSVDMSDAYRITWYKDGEQVSTGKTSNITYTATEVGTYKVKIEYVGTSGLDSYEPAEDEMTISAYEPEFAVDDNLHYCGDVAMVKVTPSKSTAEYTWYANQIGTTELGKSVGDEEITIDVSYISANMDGTKNIYVEETSTGSGLFLPEQLASWKNGMSDNIYGPISNSYATGFYVNEPITLTSVSCYVNAYLFAEGSESATLTFTVYGAQTYYSAGYIPNSDVYGSLVGTKEITTTSQQNSEKLTAVGSVSLPAGLYFIVPTNLERSDASVQFGLKRVSTSLPSTIVDNITGTILQFQSVANGSNPNASSSGYIFDITFTAGQKYCGVVPVTLSQDCPALPIDIIFDDCDDGDEITNTGGYWFTFNDKSNQLLACEPGTLSSITPYVDNDEEFAITPAIMSESGYDGTGYAVHATYTLGTNYTPYSGNSCAPWVNPAYCGVGTQVGEDAASTVDWSAGTGISFWYKGSSSLFTVAISEVEDTDFHRYTVPECTEWTKITVLWSELQQQSWGTEVTFSAKHIQKLMWEINTSYSGSEGSTGEIWIDKLCVFGLDPVELTALTIQPVHDSDLALHNLSPNINPLAIPIASGAAGDTLYLETILTPTEATYPIVIWSSSDEEVATVDSKGRVIGVSEGTATITARSKMNSEIFATFSVEVKIPCTTPDAPAVVDATYCYGDTPQELSVLASPEGSLMWYEAATGSTVHVESSQDVIGGAKSMHGSFYTFDNGVQTKAQLGDKAANVVFCFLTLDENKETLDVFRFISGTEAVNEIVQSQASETKFVMISDATQEEFEIVDWSEGTTSIDIAKTLEAGQKSVAFKNALSEGFFEVVSYDEDAEDLTINVWKIEHAALYNESTASTTAPMPNTEEVGKTTYYVSQIVNGCESEKTPITVTVNELPSVSISADKDEVCAGETITLTASVTGDESGSFKWSNNDTYATTTITATTTEIQTQTVDVMFTSAQGCTGQASTTVTVKPIPTAPSTEKVTYCQNEVGQILTATASEGAQLQWYESANGGLASTTAPTPNALIVGDTLFYVSQTLNGCESERAEVAVTVYDLPTIEISGNDDVCEGEDVTLTASANSDGAFSWSNGHTGATTTFTLDETETITVTFVTDQGCTSQASTTVEVLPIPEMPIVESVSYCQNAEAEQLTATADGDLLWYETANGGTALTTAPMPNTSIVGDTLFYVSQTLNGCESERAEVSVTVYELPTVEVSGGGEVCEGEDVTLTASANSDGAFSWSNGDMGASTMFTATATTTLNVTFASEQGCTSTAETTVMVNPIPKTPVTENVSYCQNEVGQILTATASEGAQLLWYESATGGVSNTTAPVPSTSVAGETTYYVSQTLNGCESERAEVLVTVYELPTIEISGDDEVCSGETATLTASVIGEESGSFEWSNGDTEASTTITSNTFGAYTVTVTFTSEHSCTSEASATVTVNPIPTTPVTENVSYCQNEVGQILTATASEGAQLLWYESETGGVSNTTAPVPSTSEVGETKYYVSQVVDGCESGLAQIVVEVTDCTPPIVMVAEGAQTVSVPYNPYGSGDNGSGTISSSWQVSAANVIGEAVIAALGEEGFANWQFEQGQKFTLEVEGTCNATGRFITGIVDRQKDAAYWYENTPYLQSVPVTAGKPFKATIDYSIMKLATNGFTIDGKTYKTLENIPELVVILDMDSYSAATAFNNGVAPSDDLSAVKDVEFNFTSFKFSYVEQPTLQISYNKFGLGDNGSGTISKQWHSGYCNYVIDAVKEALGEEAAADWKLQKGQQFELEMQAISSATGKFQAVILDEQKEAGYWYANTGYMDYNVVAGQSFTIKHLYTVESLASEGFTKDGVDYKTDVDVPDLSFILETVDYAAATAYNNGVAPSEDPNNVRKVNMYLSSFKFSYLGKAVEPIAEIPDVTVDEEGQVTTIELSDFFAGNESEEIIYTVTSSDPSIVYPVTRGDELEFVQYGSGTVTITVTATVGTITTTQTFTITVNPKPDQPTKPCELSVLPEITNVTCFGGEDGKIEVSVSGGVEPYQYKWNTGRTSKGIYAMAAGEYSILVRDSLGCTTTSTFTIEEPAEMSVSEEITNPSCGISNGSIAITIEGGTAPYTQRWYSGNGTIMESLENLQGDVYEVVIIDKNSCKLRKTYSLQESGAPSVSLKSVNASKCNEATGSCEIAVSSESEYTIVWSDATEATTEKSRSGMLPGTYTVTVNDAENCRSILSVTIPTETFRQPEIALVTVGEESGKNLVVWQKPETDMIAFYTVYREGDESGVYDKLGDVDFHETSIFVDPDANIMEQSWRYKISATDVCGNESPLSKEHKTIHLQKARGLDGEINLIWDSYEGIAYASYCLYRQTKSGSGLEMFKKVPASLNRYTDMNPPADVKGYYVAVVLPTEINENEPLKAESGPFALAISNIAEVENDGDIDAVDAVENDAVVYANGKNIVVLNANGKNVTINDITGRTIAQEKAVQSTVIPVQQVGVYLVTVGDKVQKVVVE